MSIDPQDRHPGGRSTDHPGPLAEAPDTATALAPGVSPGAEPDASPRAATDVSPGVAPGAGPGAAEPEPDPDLAELLVPPARPVPLWRRPGPLLATVVAAAVMVALVAIGYALGQSSTTEEVERSSAPARLADAKEACAPRSAYVRVADEGASLIISGAGAEERTGASITHLACVLAELDVPDAVVSQIEGTRALDGRQHASWDGLTASWTYHPDSGLNLILQEER